MSYDDDRERIYHPENFESLAETEERENEEGEELDTTGFNDPEVPEIKAALRAKHVPLSKIKRMTDDLNESLKRNFYAKK
jgi:hypothetical protein